jgi:CheY-like chemotaxis protein
MTTHLIGQPHAEATLARALAQDRISHAYLFVGPESVGKTTAAVLLAQALNCRRNLNLTTETRRHGENLPEMTPFSSASPYLRGEPPRAMLTVRDTGIGIEPEVLPHVFEPFAQADRSLDRTRGGLGLGLALVKGLTELHGGDVRVESGGVGRGTAFTLLLPTAPGSSPSVPASPPRVPSTGPIRILVVEDNRDAAETLRDLLELSGCRVAVAYAGPEAVAAAGQFRPEVVLCDLGLPGMDGYQVAAALRQDPALAQTRLIAISGYGQQEDQRRAREAGFDLHLTKPVEFAELQRLLEVRPEPQGA